MAENKIEKKISEKAILEREKLTKKKIPETQVAFEFQSDEDFKIFLNIMYKEKHGIQFRLLFNNNIIISKKEQKDLEKRLKQLEVKYKLVRVSPAGNLPPKEFNRIHFTLICPDDKQ